MKISATIITLNEEKNIGRCIDSLLNVADEIIVLDSFSNDKTVEIAQSKNAKVIQQPFMGYGKTKYYATILAHHDWILSLDADEALDEVLKEEVALLKKNGNADAYSMRRLNNYCGQWIRHGSWYPDIKVRLFNKKKYNWNEAAVHEKAASILPATTIRQLNGHILHYTVSTVEQHYSQAKKFASIAAEDAFIKGKKSNLILAGLAPLFKFFRDYIFKLGILDGHNGYKIALISAKAKYWKYRQLYLLQKSSSK